MIQWTPREKIVVRRVLREMKVAADTGLVTGFVHPDNGTKCTPSETLRSVAHLFASVWGVDITGIPVEEPPNPHRQPRRFLKREKKDAKAD